MTTVLKITALAIPCLLMVVAISWFVAWFLLQLLVFLASLPVLPLAFN